MPDPYALRWGAAVAAALAIRNQMDFREPKATDIHKISVIRILQPTVAEIPQYHLVLRDSSNLPQIFIVRKTGMTQLQNSASVFSIGGFLVLNIR